MDTTYRIETTYGGLNNYKVYKKTYLTGQQITLDGNWFGSTVSNTNYFVILKRAGDLANGFSSSLCEATPGSGAPISITNLIAIPDNTKAVLQWENPLNANLESIVIRGGTLSPPLLMNDGYAPSGSLLNSNTFEITGLLPNQNYYYSVFSVTSNQVWQRHTVMLTTGADLDGDEIADVYENLTLVGGNPISSSAALDTDSDGIDDRTELINGTSPTNPDTIIPVVNAFSPQNLNWNGSNYVTQFPVVNFNFNAYDNEKVAFWMVTTNSIPPLGSDSRWDVI